MRDFARRVGTMACLSGIFAASPALAAGEASGSFQVSAVVPMACWVNHTVQADARREAQGLVLEGCNNGSGYVVSAQHRQLSASERGELHYGQATVDLAGQTVHQVNRQYGPRIQKVAYSFSNMALTSSLTLTMTIQAL